MWRKSHSKIQAYGEFGITIQREGSERACLDCIGKPGENQIWKSERTSELVKCAEDKHGETRIGRQLIKLLRKEHCRQMVFSSVEIWWNVGNKFVDTRRWQVCHRWWHGLWHRHRIEPFSENTIILEQGEWSIVKDIGPFFRRCSARHRKTFCDLRNVYVFDIGSICIHGNELLRQFTFHQKYRAESHFKADVRDIWKVDIGTIRWDFGSVSNQLGKFSMETIIFGQDEEVISLSHAKQYIPVHCL